VTKVKHKQTEHHRIDGQYRSLESYHRHSNTPLGARCWTEQSDSL